MNLNDKQVPEDRGNAASRRANDDAEESKASAPAAPPSPRVAAAGTAAARKDDSSSDRSSSEDTDDELAIEAAFKSKAIALNRLMLENRNLLHTTAVMRQEIYRLKNELDSVRPVIAALEQQAREREANQEAAASSSAVGQHQDQADGGSPSSNEQGAQHVSNIQQGSLLRQGMNRQVSTVSTTTASSTAGTSSDAGQRQWPRPQDGNGDYSDDSSSDPSSSTQFARHGSNTPQESLSSQAMNRQISFASTSASSALDIGMSSESGGDNEYVGSSSHPSTATSSHTGTIHGTDSKHGLKRNRESSSSIGVRKEDDVLPTHKGKK